MVAQKFDWASVGGRPAESVSSEPFDWASVGGRPEKKPTVQGLLSDEQIKTNHPYLSKIAEFLQGTPGLKAAGNIAGGFNKAVEASGLPSAARGFLGTGIDIGRGIANLLPGIDVKKQELPQLYANPYVAEGAQTIGSLGMGLPLYRGYQGITKGLEVTPGLKMIPEKIRNLLAGTTTGAVISPDDRFLGGALGAATELAPSAISAVKNKIKGLNSSYAEKELFKARAEHEMQKNALESLKNLTQHEFGASNPEKLLLSAADKRAQLEAAKKFKANRIGEEKMLPGQQLIPEAEYGVSNVNQLLNKTLGEGEPNIQNLSKHIVEAIEGVPTVRPHPKTGLPQDIREGGLREEIGRQYDILENELPDIKIPQSPDLNEIEKELASLTGAKSSLTDAEKDSLRQVLIASHPSSGTKTINGKKFFRAYRSLRSLEGEQRSKAFGLSPEAHDEWISRANKTKQTYEDMEKIIKEHFPENSLKRLHDINYRYSKEVAPLHENEIYQQMLKHGRVNGNVIEKLSGTTKGNNILNKLISSNPELSRLLIGNEYAGKAEKLLKPNKLLEPYLKANPEISRLVGLQKEAQTQLQTAKQNAELFKHVEDIPNLNKQIKEQEALAKRLAYEAEVSGITRQELAKKELEYNKVQRNIVRLRNKLIGASAISGALAVGYQKLKQ